jgi:hypothetical protein
MGCKQQNIKGKFNPVPEHHSTKTMQDVKVNLHTFLIPVLDGNEWSDSCSSSFTPTEGPLSSHLVTGWMDTKVGLDTVAKRKIAAPVRNRAQFVKSIHTHIVMFPE